MSVIPAAGRSIAVGRTGLADGTPVVLVHGYAGDMNGWAFNVPALAQRAPVIAIDLPGHGGSEKDVGDASLTSFAATVSAVLEALGVERAHFVGHSLGGAVVARLAIDRPDLAASLTLIAPAYLPGTALNESFLTDIAEGARAKDLRPALELLTHDPSLVTREMVEDVVKYKRLDGVEEALIAIRDRMLAGDDARALQADLPRIARALVIASHKDAIVGTPSSLPPGFEVVWIDGAGHLPHIEKANAVDELLLRQLEKD